MFLRPIRSIHQKYRIDISNLKIIQQLGHGGFGTVYEVQNTKTGVKSAAKIIIQKEDNIKHKAMVNNEISILLKLNHPTIVKFIGYSFIDLFGQQNVTIFTELAPKGSLEKYLQDARKGLADAFYDDTCRQIILIGIARGMMYLHQNNIMHRDLKPGNILLDKNMYPLITDFGLAKTQCLYSMSQTIACGTTIYKAPEIIKGGPYTAKIDVYAFAILMYEIVTDSHPYPLLVEGEITPLELEEKVLKENYRPKFTVPVKESIQELIKKCWSKNPKERPTFESIFKKLAYGYDDLDDDIFNDNEYDSDESDKYYLKDVDVDKVIEYTELIKTNSSLIKENEELKKKLDDANKMNELAMNPLKIEMKTKIDNLQKENVELKKKLEIEKQSNLAMNHLNMKAAIRQSNNKKQCNVKTLIVQKSLSNPFKMKLSLYAKIQLSLCNLKPDSSDLEIDQLINQIPKNFLSQKDDLMIICQLFAYFSIFHSVKMKSLVIKLFEKIMNPIKTILNDESFFFCSIFPNDLYFRAWMYENGLISIEQIIVCAQYGKPKEIEYFLPEIYSLKREIFEKELKFRLKKAVTPQLIKEIKETRIKHFRWLKESADYNDPSYKEIEKNPLRLAIKQDDIESFQQIFSKSNLSVNHQIIESLYDDFSIINRNTLLIDFAALHGAIKIFKFLINKGADTSSFSTILATLSGNNKEIIQIYMNKITKNVEETLLIQSIYQWNLEITESELKKARHEYFYKNVLNPQSFIELKSIIEATFQSINFIFYESTLARFFENNPNFVKANIYFIITDSFHEQTCFFSRELMKNAYYDNSILLKSAIEISNKRAVEILLNDPKTDINVPLKGEYSAIYFSCSCYKNIEITKLLCENPNLDTYFLSKLVIMTTYGGGFYHLQIIFNSLPTIDIKEAIGPVVYNCLKVRHLYSLKLFLKYYIDTKKNIDKFDIDTYIISASDNEEKTKSFLDEFNYIYNEIVPSNKKKTFFVKHNH